MKTSKNSSPPPFAPRKVGAFGPDQSPLLPLTPPHHTTAPHTPHTHHPFTCSFLSTPTNHHPNKALVLLSMLAFLAALSGFSSCCLALLVVLLVLLALLVVLLVLLVLLTVRACICNWCWSWRGRYGCPPHQGWSLDPATPHYRTTTPAHTSSFHLLLPSCTHHTTLL